MTSSEKRSGIAQLTDDKMLARIAALLRQAESTDNTTKPTRSWRPRTAGHHDVHRPGRGPHARCDPLACARRRCNAPSPSARQAPRAGGTTLVVRGNRSRQRPEVRCRIQLDVRLRLRVAEDIDATHALYASLVMQMVKRPRPTSGRATPAHPHHHGEAELPAGIRARVGQRLADAREEVRRRPARTANTAQAPNSHCATRTSS